MRLAAGDGFARYTLTFDGSKFSIFINGELTGTSNVQQGPLLYGPWTRLRLWAWDGPAAVDNIRMFEGALSPTLLDGPLSTVASLAIEPSLGPSRVARPHAPAARRSLPETGAEPAPRA